jgi:hypothetical protein
MLLIVGIGSLMLLSCKKNNNDYYLISNPTFSIIETPDVPQNLYAVCTSHDVIMDSIYVVSSLNIKSRFYYHNQLAVIDEAFLIGNTFTPSAGIWQFLFYGKKAVNGQEFIVFEERKLYSPPA